MGARAQVLIKDEGVYLYTHWDAGVIESTVRAALKKQWRWGHPAYLARIIFDEMTLNEHGTHTGFGIGTTRYTDIKKLVVVDCKNQKVIVEDVLCGEKKQYTFKEFVSRG